MSVSPRQNFLNPPPVPEILTFTRTAFCFPRWNSAAAASVMGKTVLDPSATITAGCGAAVGLFREAPSRALPYRIERSARTSGHSVLSPRWGGRWSRACLALAVRRTGLANVVQPTLKGRDLLGGRANVIDPTLKGQLVKFLETEAREDAYSRVEFHVRALDSKLQLQWPLNGRRIGDAPVRGHRLSRPQRARLAGGVIAHGEDEVEWGAIGSGELSHSWTGGCHLKLSCRRISIVTGWTSPRGRLPALNARKRPRAQRFREHSAMMLRAELPVQRNRTL